MDREDAVLAQRERLMSAFCEVVAARGMAGLIVADVVSRAGVSRTSFYNCFDGLEGCADAAYERFIEVLINRLLTALDPSLSWEAYVSAGIRAYLETLEADPVVARAMQIELDAVGRKARVRRREALTRMAEVIGARYADLMEDQGSLGEVPVEGHLALIYAVRQLACDALDTEDNPDLQRLVEPTVKWISSTIHGTIAINRSREGAAPGDRPD